MVGLHGSRLDLGDESPLVHSSPPALGGTNVHVMCTFAHVRGCFIQIVLYKRRVYCIALGLSGGGCTGDGTMQTSTRPTSAFLKHRLVGSTGGRNLALAVVAGLCVMAGSRTGYAQLTGKDAVADTDALALTEVVVTAQRRSENLQAVPITVAAFGPETLDAASIASVRDLGVVSPSFQYIETAGWVQPTLRGVGTPAIGPGLENPIATYVDGVYEATMYTAAVEFDNVARVEVISGPQGTLFGRNATGGLVQVNTKDPTNSFAGTTNIGLEDYQTVTGSLYLGGPVTSDVAANVSVQFRNQNQGFGHNLDTGSPMDSNSYFDFRSKWLFDISDRTRLKLVADAGYLDSPPNDQTTQGSIPFGGPNPDPFRPHYSRGVLDTYNRVWEGGVSATLSHSLDSAQFTSITAFRQSNLDHRDSSTTIANPDFSFNFEVHEPHTQLTQEFQLSSAESSKMTWTLGAYYFYEKSKYDPASIYGGLITSYFLPPYTLSQVAWNTDAKTQSGALYAQITAPVATATNLTLGARYTRETRNIDITQDAAIAAAYPGDPVNPPAAAGDQFISSASGSETFNNVSWRFALDHNFTQELMGYVSYNRGFKSGGYNVLNVPLVSFSPETLNAYEVGLKSEVLDRRLRLNGSAFYYDYTNMQVVAYVDNIFVITNAASSRLYGLDLNAQAYLGSRLKINAGMSLMHSYFASFPNAPINTPAPGPYYGNTSGVADVSGKTLPHAPKIVMNLIGTYTIPLSKGHLDLTGAYLHNGGWYGEPDNRLRQPAYDVVNLMADWKATTHSGVRLWVKNVGNTDYAVYLASAFYADYIQFAAPRTYGVTVYHDF